METWEESVKFKKSQKQENQTRLIIKQDGSQILKF